MAQERTQDRNRKRDRERAEDRERERDSRWTRERVWRRAGESFERARRSGLVRRAANSYVVLVVLGLVVGLLVAPVAVSVVTTPASGTIAVVPVEGSITGASAAAYATTLQRAKQDPDVAAVVLLVNSPGGTAPGSETMYLATERVAEGMPVVSSVDSIAASGAYYTAVGSDYIFAKPSSLVGSVGVLFVPPPELEPTDGIIATGPNKLTGADERGWNYKTEALQAAFLGAVETGRGDALELSRSEVATAELFTGAEAVENGMADEIGGTREAIAKAAEMAGLAQFDVRLMRPEGPATFVTRSAYLASDAPDKELVTARYFLGPRGTQFPSYLMLPPGIVRAALQRSAPADARLSTGTNTTGAATRAATGAATRAATGAATGPTVANTTGVDDATG